MRKPTHQGPVPPTQPRELDARDGLPTLGIAHFAMIASASEILIPLGQSRVVIEKNADGSLNPIQTIEWMQALSVPPSVAVMLREGLSGAIDHYEKSFGPIACDPSTSVKVEVKGPKRG